MKPTIKHPENRDKYTMLLMGGHAGLINGYYATGGKRSPNWSKVRGRDKIVYEGMHDRQIKYRVMELLEFNGYKFVDLVPEHTDVRLSIRVGRANEIYKSNRNIILYDIHANAARVNEGSGCEVIIAKRASRTSRVMANALKDTFKDHFDDIPFRRIMRKNLYVVRNTRMPVVTFEAPFMTTEQECRKYLMTSSGRDTVAKWLYHSILTTLIELEK